jgi:hypothetical protein
MDGQPHPRSRAGEPEADPGMGLDKRTHVDLVTHGQESDDHSWTPVVQPVTDIIDHAPPDVGGRMGPREQFFAKPALMLSWVHDPVPHRGTIPQSNLGRLSPRESDSMASVQSVTRAFRILEALATGESGITELAARADLPKSTVARLTRTLEESAPSSESTTRVTTGSGPRSSPSPEWRVPLPTWSRSCDPICGCWPN